jgi:ABC-type spermidine/putrescine transport system permease subunit I
MAALSVSRGTNLAHGAVLLLPAAAVISAFFLMPIALLLQMAFTADSGNPSMENISYVFSRDAYWRAAALTIVLSGFAAALSVGASLPTAYYLALHCKFGRVWLFFLSMTFWVNMLVRIVSFKVFLGPSGPLHWLFGTGLSGRMLYNDVAVTIAIAYSELPVCLSVLFASTAAIDTTLIEAARHLGADPWQVFQHVTFPSIRKGLTLAFGLSFLYGATSFLEAELLGPAQSVMLGTLLRNQFDHILSWHRGSALALLSLAAVSCVIALLLALVPVGRYLYAVSVEHS